ncbi:hypothetical protein FJ364_04480, partial [Candidatus Dependentiae bacterium]|nr:hypothetical protein [Candidatus Dependentiae bacterium]
VPIVVGGSLFYVQSIFFPPNEFDFDDERKNVLIEYNSSFEYSWEMLAKIDPTRASQLHPNDTYRIKRALHIWQQSRLLPSQLQPVFNFTNAAYLLMLMPEKEILHKRIEQRALSMLEQEEWITEAASLMNTEWEPFIRSKGLLGYDLIFDALRDGNANPSQLAPLIVTQTWQYAKRQLTFLRGFIKKILTLRDQKKSIIIHRCSDHRDISFTQAARLVAYLQK